MLTPPLPSWFQGAPSRGLVIRDGQHGAPVVVGDVEGLAASTVPGNRGTRKTKEVPDPENRGLGRLGPCIHMYTYLHNLTYIYYVSIKNYIYIILFIYIYIIYAV